MFIFFLKFLHPRAALNVSLQLSPLLSLHCIKIFRPWEFKIDRKLAWNHKTSLNLLSKKILLNKTSLNQNVYKMHDRSFTWSSFNTYNLIEFGKDTTARVYLIVLYPTYCYSLFSNDGRNVTLYWRILIYFCGILW